VTKVVVCGALGRMGRRVVELSRSEKDIKLVGAVEAKGHPGVGLVVSENVELTDSIEKVIETCDVLVDFTQPESAVANVGAAYKAKKAVSSWHDRVFRRAARGAWSVYKRDTVCHNA